MNSVATRAPSTSPPFFTRFGPLIVVVTLLLVPWIFWGAQRAVTRFENDVRQWLPRGFSEAETYAWFSEHFGVDELVIASWASCDLNDPRIPVIAAGLQQPAADGTIFFRRVVTGPELYLRLRSPPYELSEAAARERLRGTLIGTDDQTTALLAWGTESAADDRRAAVEHVRRVAAEAGVSREQLHLGGPTVDGATIDSESRKLLFRQTAVSILVLFGAAWYRLKRLTLVACTIGVGILAGALSLSLLYYTGGRMNLTLVMLPTLVFILTVSASIHVVNYFWHAVMDLSPRPAERAMVSGWVPCALATLTSTIGLVSLSASQVTPIKQFGLYSGMSLVLSLPLVLLLLPTLLHWDWRRDQRRQTAAVPQPPVRFAWLDPLVSRICLSHRTITLLFIVLMVLGACGLARVKTTVKIQHRFASRSKIIQDYLWLEQHLGPLVPLEVVIRFPANDPRDEWERFEVMRWVELALLDSPEILATFSAGTFRPVLRSGRTAGAVAQRSLVIDAWRAARPQREAAGFVATDPETGAELWHFTARVYAINELDYGRFVEQLKRDVRQRLIDNQVDAPEILYTGGIPLIYKAQRQILVDLVTSFAWAFAIIMLTFMVILRSVWAGLVAMLPNLFPPVVVIGSMGWFGLTLDIGSVMTASVALGMAVDGTFHYLTWYRRQVTLGGSRRTATRSAMRHCARALFDATVICALGVIPFTFTLFLPTLRFAVMLSVLMFVALVGDLVFLPSLLVGRWGALFGRRRDRPQPLPGHVQPPG